MTQLNNLDVYIYCPNCSNKLTAQIIDKETRKKCNHCGFIFWNNPKPVVSMVIAHEKKVLMLQRSFEPFKDYWVLPGGFIGYEEAADVAIKREVEEETGLNAEIRGIVGVYRIDNDPRGIHIDIIYYGVGAGDYKLSEEDKKYGFFDPTALPELIAYKHREAIVDWNKIVNIVNK